MTTRNLLWATCALLLTAGAINSCTIARAEVEPGIHEIPTPDRMTPRRQIKKVDYSEDDRPVFRPWQLVWQCNDIRVTVTSRTSDQVEYDLGGSIWGGSRFNIVRGDLFFNGRPCVFLGRWP